MSTKAKYLTITGFAFLILLGGGVYKVWEEYKAFKTWQTQATGMVNSHTQAIETLVGAFNQLNQRVNGSASE